MTSLWVRSMEDNFKKQEDLKVLKGNLTKNIRNNQFKLKHDNQHQLQSKEQ